VLKQRIKFFIASVNRDDLEAVGQLIDEGKLRPVIDRTFPMGETVAAVEYAEGMQAAGKVVIKIAG